MLCVNEQAVGNVGASLKFKMAKCNETFLTALNLEGLVHALIMFTRPDSSTFDVDGHIYYGGPNGTKSDGIIEYITKTGDLDMSGQWYIKIKLTFTTGIFYSDTDDSLVVSE